MPNAGICAHNLHVYPDLEHLSEAAAERWIALCHAAISQRGAFHVALAGGSTPKRVYQLLARPERCDRIDWARVQIYFGDERAVPPTHADSNFRMAHEALLAHIDIPAANVQRMAATPEHIDKDAVDYAALLRERLPRDVAGIPVFDLIMLGMGADGHTCSLFPDSPILHERARSIGAVYVERLQSWRLSLTYPVLDAARQLMFLVAGSDKAAMLRRICHPDTTAPAVPVQDIRPRGQVDWYLDAHAAAELRP
ncbi:MAG: 6-phosphogluconolactonase [Gammaproteobacteria bacterium]|nr:6-phosphogluconolactonase [Gammaproteobacteria bacterium]